MTRTRRQLAAALLTAVAGGAVGVAQTGTRSEPAARLLPAVPVESTLVTRGYAPEPGTFGDTKPPVKTLTEQRSWTGAPLSATANRPSTTVSATPPKSAAPAPAPSKPAAPPPPAYATGTGGVYAGPPAYRWYGYGTTTPGANPLAPAGQYPKGSANWYAQTGATPGAFPVPVTAGGEPVPRYEPPAYAANATPPAPTYTPAPSSVPTYPATARETRPVPSFVPPASPPPSRPASTVLPPPTIVPPTIPTPPPTTELLKAPGEPAPIAVSATPPAPPSTVPSPKVEPPAPVISPAPTGGLSWQAAPGTKDAPTFTAAKTEVPIATSAAPPVAAQPKDEPAAITFKPSQPAPSPSVVVEPSPAPAPIVPPVPVPTVPVVPPAVLPPATDWKAAPQARGQQPTAEPVSLASQLRNACYGLATVAEVTHTGPTTLTVRLTAASEADARTAAAQAAKLPALRPYTVRFVIELAR